ncbi:hypothetical protein ARMGADRAFT_1091502 [Armillaria gallica]|uniref:Uncharacterized protein n=1 Tax=Armillaria gallica TaxID=47427 RepID=A0A2H3CDS2_ARMGA|nr:hypothetical protein ARMGADRAFT_1091502 [Armillaria gallica]
MPKPGDGMVDYVRLDPSQEGARSFLLNFTTGREKRSFPPSSTTVLAVPRHIFILHLKTPTAATTTTTLYTAAAATVNAGLLYGIWHTKDYDVENFSSYRGRDGLPRFRAQSNCGCKYEDLPTRTHPHLGFAFNLFVRMQLPLHFVMSSNDAWVLYHDESGQKEIERRLGKNGDTEFGVVQAEGGTGEMFP